MFLVNGIKATLRQFNRTENSSAYDDQNYKEIAIKCCPYDADQAIKFGIYTHDEGTGYYQIPRYVDIKVGDQIVFKNKFGKELGVHTVLKLQDEWIFNRIENYIAVVKRN